MKAHIEAIEGNDTWLAQRAKRSPDRVALVVGASTLSYGQLDEEARSLADGLRAAGVGSGDTVAARLEDGVDFARLLWALREIRAAVLPINPRWVAEEAGHVLADSRASLLVDDGSARAEAGAQRAGGVPRAVLHQGQLERQSEGSSEGRSETRLAEFGHPRLGGEEEDILAVLYTSGTTGRPKGAMLSAAAFQASARGAAELLGTGPDERWLACMPLFHVGGLSILLRACLAGSSVVVQPGFNAGAVSRALDDEAISGVSLVAAMLQRLLEVRGDRPPPASLRWLLLGGGPAPEALLVRARQLGYPLAPTYGLTEAASQVATRLPAEDALPLDGHLRPLPGTALKVLDEEGRTLPAGQAGEIYIRGGTLMSGYLGQPEATERVFQKGWLRSGDIGVLDLRGYLRVLDRREDLIVSGGENIYPAEIEAVLAQHPAVAEAAVVGEPDEEFGARPVAYWVAAPGAEETDLRAYCRERLAGYKVPRRFARMEALPRNSAGKVLRRELRGSSGSEPA